jgi:hypothetical protein
MKSEYNEGDTTFAPVEYGVVVIDFLQRTVYVANSYSRMEDTILGDAEMMRMRIGLDEADEGGEGAAFREMLSRGQLSLIQYPAKKLRKTLLRIPITDVTEATWDEKVYQPCKDKEEEGHFFFSLGINFEGWTFKHYPHEIEGHEQLRADLREAGLTVTPEDDAKFEVWRAERQAAEDEDE